MAATRKFSCRNLVGPSLSRPTLFWFGLVWSNQTAGKMYPEIDIRRNNHTENENPIENYSVLA